MESFLRGLGLYVCLSLILGGLMLAGCSGSRQQPPPAGAHPVTHVVQPGENLYRISKQYGVSPERIMAANGINDPRDLRVGQTLVIPGVYGSVLGSQPRIARGHPADRQFAWPILGGYVSSGFGIRDGVMHDGIDIATAVGTPVHAAGTGEVIFAGKLRGYGNVVIVRHDDHYVTIYGHNEVNQVSEGDRVHEGQVIGQVGSTGRTTGPNLHFEVRRDNVADNPLDFLPPPPASDTSFARSGGA